MHPRRLWEVVEPIHAVQYFAPEPAAAMKALGLKGWWMGYFAGRAAPLGDVGSAVVTATFFGFAPSMVERAVPDCWALASPADVLRARIQAIGEGLDRVAPDTNSAELADLLCAAVEGCRFDGRPLAAAWSTVAPHVTIPALEVWLAATVLREHRGDGHVAAAVAQGLTGLETSLTMVATGAVTRESLQPSRGWTDEEWDDAHRGLVERGLIDEHGALTPEGAALRGRIEATTDALAASPLEHLGPEREARLIELATPITRALFDSGAIPVPNPIGVPRP